MRIVMTEFARPRLFPREPRRSTIQDVSAAVHPRKVGAKANGVVVSAEHRLQVGFRAAVAGSGAKPLQGVKGLDAHCAARTREVQIVQTVVGQPQTPSADVGPERVDIGKADVRRGLGQRAHKPEMGFSEAVLYAPANFQLFAFGRELAEHDVVRKDLARLAGHSQSGFYIPRRSDAQGLKPAGFKLPLSAEVRARQPFAAAAVLPGFAQDCRHRKVGI